MDGGVTTVMGRDGVVCWVDGGVVQQTGLSVILGVSSQRAPQDSQLPHNHDHVTVMDHDHSTTKVVLILQLTAGYRQLSGCGSRAA